jgi:Zn-dependent protease with chaperone function
MSRGVMKLGWILCFAVAATLLAASVGSAHVAAPPKPGLVWVSATLPPSDAPPPVLLAAAQQPAPQDVKPAPIALIHPVAPDGGKSTPAELEMGKQAAAQIEKEYKPVDDPAAVERLNKIIARVRPNTERPAVEYEPKILAQGGINAFSLPGGYVYVTKSLLEAVESEDELAAVIAHEMAHVCLKHGMDLAKREAKMNNKMAVGVLAAVLAGNNVDPGNMIILGGLLKTALLSGYTQEAENQADADAVVYLQRSGYHPVAMLTVIQGLARMEITRPYVELGIFQTHPFPQERARLLRQELLAMGLDSNPRPVWNTLQTKADTAEENGRTVGRVSIDENVIFEPVVEANGLSPQQRAEKMAADLRRIILQNLAMYEVRVGSGDSSATVFARGAPVITVVPGDAEFRKTTVEDLAAKAAANIKLALWQETVRRAY